MPHSANSNVLPTDQQSWNRTILQRDMTVSIESERPGNINLNNRRTSVIVEEQISNSPPAYDETRRQSSVKIKTQQQFLLPPSYEDFMRRQNRNDETNL
ncbi:unnamed protein product [Adineta steineri]|uniref:Uncharacterized protein n=1 Tax=Adineta steineri TaxID=433720 RepID=A0A815K897_9BILA|nr:unnamed protein product [Adineta steineri]CAF1445245.1 unnamed protein product [Adineta steineri]CAF1445864.1 unnamed protein product [Adineta steineri]